MVPRGWKRSDFQISDAAGGEDVSVFAGGCGVSALFSADHGLVWFGGGGWKVGFGWMGMER